MTGLPKETASIRAKTNFQRCTRLPPWFLNRTAPSLRNRDQYMKGEGTLSLREDGEDLSQTETSCWSRLGGSARLRIVAAAACSRGEFGENTDAMKERFKMMLRGRIWKPEGFCFRSGVFGPQTRAATLLESICRSMGALWTRLQQEQEFESCGRRETRRSSRRIRHRPSLTRWPSASQTHRHYKLHDRLTHSRGISL